jgi:hypothetical protein
LGQRKNPTIPAMIIKMDPSHTVSTQTPIIPPTMLIMNMINNTSVLDEVGNISEAMRLAEEPAGEVKMNMKQISISSHMSYLIAYEHMSNIPETESI